MGMYWKGYRSLGGGRWVKVSRRGVAVGQHLGRVGPLSFGYAVGTHRRRRRTGEPTRQFRPRHELAAWLFVLTCFALIVLIALAS